MPCQQTADVASTRPRFRPLLLASVVRRTAADEGAALVRALRVLPPPVARALRVAASRIPGRFAGARIAVALGLDQLDEAARLLAALPPHAPARPRLTALLQWERGDGDSAVRTLAGSVPPGREGRRTAGLRRRLDAELAVLTPPQPAPARPPQWVPARPPQWVPARRPSPQPARVLHLLTNSLPHTTAGYTIRSQQVLAAQRRAGLDARALTRIGYPVTAGVLRAASLDVVDGVPYGRLLPRTGLPRYADDLRAAALRAAGAVVERDRPGVLHATTDHVNGQLALALRQRYGLPVVYEVRGFLEESWRSRRGDVGADSERYRRARELETACMRAADLVVTLGERMRAEIVARGVAADRVLVAPNAVDASFLGPVPSGRPVRARLGFGPGDLVLGAVTTLAEHEGLGTLLRAAALLVARGVPARVLLVGDGPAAARLRGLGAELGLGDRLVLAGRVPYGQVRPWYAALDVFVVPRTAARVCQLVTPLKPVEAMGLGLAVVGSDVGGLRDLVAPGRTGLLVRPDDPVALADCLQALHRDPGRGRQLGTAARTEVAATRTWDGVAQRYLTAYRRLGVTLPAASSVGP